MADLEYKMLAPASKRSMYVSHLIIVMAIITVAVFSGMFLMKYLAIASYLIYACAALLTIFFLVRPVLYHRFYRYVITDDRIDTRQGVLVRSHTVVPIERIHQVEVVRGPINGMFGLANVKITTAGGVAQIKFLEIPVAESIVDGLNEVINKIIRGRNSDA